MDLKLDLNELIELRHTLHAHAELSNQEEETAQIIYEFIKKFDPDHIWENVGGHGLIALFKGKKEGPNIGFRADLDALHIAETISLDYASYRPHTSHKCGHDGHMTILSGLAAYLGQNKIEQGNVYLVFQPAEETGEGADRINRAFTELDIKLDYLFGLHNLPGYPKGQILTKPDTFAAGSSGMVIRLLGRTSHAGEPENGVSPVMAIAEISTKMSNIHKTEIFSNLTLATVVHSELGNISFGISPGYGEVRATLRAMNGDDMDHLMKVAEKLVVKTAKSNNLHYDIYYTEIFPITENTEESFQIMKNSAERAKLDFKNLELPFRWSEDFGQYKLQTKSGFFGLGAGEDTPHLHDETYDFPDDIISAGVEMYASLVDHFNLFERKN